MNTILWVVQVILAIKLLATAFSHGLRQNESKMRVAVDRMGGRAGLWHALFAILMVLGAVGLMLPPIGFGLWLAPVAAAVTAALMLLSVFLHIRTRERPTVFADVILFLMAAFVAYERWLLAPL